MNEARIGESLTLLLDLWQRGKRVGELPSELRPATRAEGYAVQAGLEVTCGPIAGWKIAATSAAGQAHIGVDGPLAGRLPTARVFQDGATLDFGANHMAVVEAEFCFRMGRDLPPCAEDYTVDEVLAAVADLHPAIEIPDSRFEDFASVGAAQLIADNACAHEFVLGPASAADWRTINLAAHPVVGEVAGGPRHHGTGANVLGDPRVALAWLVNKLSGLGITLAAGQFVTTGTCLQPIPVRPGARVAMDFGALGRVEMAFADQRRV